MPVLVVDDDPLVTKLVAMFLREYEFKRVDTSQDGPAALALIRENRYQLVISDFKMEPMTGLDLLKALRASWQTRATYFIMMAGGTQVEQVIAAHHAGMDGYILKPFTRCKLRSKIEEVFSSRRWTPSSSDQVDGHRGP